MKNNRKNNYIHILAGLLTSLSTSALAQVGFVDHPWLTARFQADVGYAFAGQETDIEVDSKVFSRVGTKINLEKDLELDDSEGSVSGAFKWRFGEKWSFAAQYFGTNRSAETVLQQEIEWEDESFLAGAQVSGGFSYDIYRMLFGRRFLTGEHYEFGAGIGAHWMDLSAFIAGEAFVDGESQGQVSNDADAAAPLPNFGVWYTWAWNERWAFNARVDWLDASVGDYSGLLINSAVQVGWQPWERVGFVAQYSFFKLSVDVDDTDWRGEVDATWDGPYLGVSFNW